jgi:hypothetical protein
MAKVLHDFLLAQPSRPMSAPTISVVGMGEKVCWFRRRLSGIANSFVGDG